MNTTHGPDPHSPEPDSLDPAESLRLIGELHTRTRSAVAPDDRLLFGVWGLAWLVGYLSLWFSATDDLSGFPWNLEAVSPSTPAYLVFAGALTLAVVFTIVHTLRRSAGLRGVSARAGALYGWSWPIAFSAFSFVIGGLASAGASGTVIALASNAFASTIVGLLYLGGGIAFRDRGLYILGVWILLVGAFATLAGVPLTYLVMAGLGGGGFLLMGLIDHVLLVRRRGRSAPPPGAGTGDE